MEEGRSPAAGGRARERERHFCFQGITSPLLFTRSPETISLLNKAPDCRKLITFKIGNFRHRITAGIWNSSTNVPSKFELDNYLPPTRRSQLDTFSLTMRPPTASQCVLPPSTHPIISMSLESNTIQNNPAHRHHCNTYAPQREVHAFFTSLILC